MNVLFLTIGDFSDLKAGSVHIDIVKEIVANGHQVYVACNNTDINAEDTQIIHQDGVALLKIKTGTVKKNTNLISKGIATVLLESTYINAIKKRLADVKFDLVLYHTPPITFEKVVRFVKKRDGAASYLLLKDIFPQNAIDLGMMSKHGLKGLIYRYFRKKEKNLYQESDYIGCMSPANVEFILKHNPFISKEKVEVAPNSIDLRSASPLGSSKNPNANGNDKDKELKEKNERYYIRKKYDLPTDRPIFIYGGNLGKPQGIDYLIKCLDANKNRTDCYFVIVGSGSEYRKLDSWFNEKGADSCVKIMQSLPKEDYEMLAKYCDVGLIFLDCRFTIPNYPSRLLSYLVNKMPVICATDVNTDIGKIAEDNGYGYWCESVKPEDFTALVDKMLKNDLKAMGQKGYDYLCDNYLAKHTYRAIFNHFENK